MRTYYKKLLYILSAILVFTATSCKDDSSSPNDISIQIVSVTPSLVELNECNIDAGPTASEFLFEVEYEASDDIDIDGVEFDLDWTSGDQANNIFTNSFNADDETVVFDWCFRFGNEEQWFEIDLKIIAEDEDVESNEFKIRVDRPEGANKSTL